SYVCVVPWEHPHVSSSSSAIVTMGILNPTTTRLSPHFLLSDVMGCSSVYARGLANVFDKKPGTDIRLTNLRALCENALEPILASVGSFSITYGFISPEVSREL